MFKYFKKSDIISEAEDSTTPKQYKFDVTINVPTPVSFNITSNSHESALQQAKTAIEQKYPKLTYTINSQTSDKTP